MTSQDANTLRTAAKKKKKMDLSDRDEEFPAVESHSSEIAGRINLSC
jgi:hypothetical protein